MNFKFCNSCCAIKVHLTSRLETRRSLIVIIPLKRTRLHDDRFHEFQKEFGKFLLLLSRLKQHKYRKKNREMRTREEGSGVTIVWRQGTHDIVHVPIRCRTWPGTRLKQLAPCAPSWSSVDESPKTSRGSPFDYSRVIYRANDVLKYYRGRRREFRRGRRTPTTRDSFWELSARRFRAVLPTLLPRFLPFLPSLPPFLFAFLFYNSSLFFFLFFFFFSNSDLDIPPRFLLRVSEISLHWRIFRYRHSNPLFPCLFLLSRVICLNRCEPPFSPRCFWTLDELTDGDPLLRRLGFNHFSSLFRFDLPSPLPFFVSLKEGELFANSKSRIVLKK